MILRILLPILISFVRLCAEDAVLLKLPDSTITLTAPDDWVIKKMNGELSIYSPDQPAQGSESRIHIERLRNAAETLEAAIEAEIDSITKRSPGSSNSRKNHKGNIAVKTASGLQGLRADFYFEQTKDSVTTKKYHIVKYYFFDENRNIFKICSHIYDGEDKLKLFESLILANLTLNSPK